MYARENLNNYPKVKYFNPFDAIQLSKIMSDFILYNTIKYDFNNKINFDNPLFFNWNDLLDKIIYD